MEELRKAGVTVKVEFVKYLKDNFCFFLKICFTNNPKLQHLNPVGVPRHKDAKQAGRDIPQQLDILPPGRRGDISKSSFPLNPSCSLAPFPPPSGDPVPYGHPREEGGEEAGRGRLAAGQLPGADAVIWW